MRCRNRLVDERGASFLVALLFILICLLVALAIIGAAGVNSERSRQLTTESQDYLTLDSAVALSRDVFSTDTELSTLKVTKADETSDLVATPANPTGALAKWAATQASNIMQGKPATASDPYYVNATNAYSGDGLTQAVIVYSMANDFTITAKVKLNGSADYDYTLTTTIDPVLSGSYVVDPDTGAITYGKDFTVSWNKVTP